MSPYHCWNLTVKVNISCLGREINPSVRPSFLPMWRNSPSEFLPSLAFHSSWSQSSHPLWSYLRWALEASWGWPNFRSSRILVQMWARSHFRSWRKNPFFNVPVSSITNISSITNMRNLVVLNFLPYLQLKIIIANRTLTDLPMYSFSMFFKLSPENYLLNLNLLMLLPLITYQLLPMICWVKCKLFSIICKFV